MHAFFARQRLSALLDGELSPEERAQVEALLAEDEELRSTYEGMRESVSLLRRLGPAAAPEGFGAEVQAARAEKPSGRGPLWVAALGLVAAAGLVLLLLPGDEHSETGQTEELAELHAEIAAAPIEVATVEPPPPEAPAEAPAEAPTEEPVEPVEAAPAPAPVASRPAAQTTPRAERAPYQADWEQSSQLSRSRSVRMHATGGSVLFELAGLAAGHGGQVLRGTPVQLDTETAYGQLTVELPAASLPAFMAGLGTLGSLTSAPPHPAGEGEDLVELLVEVQYH